MVECVVVIVEWWLSVRAVVIIEWWLSVRAVVECFCFWPPNSI